MHEVTKDPSQRVEKHAEVDVKPSLVIGGHLTGSTFGMYLQKRGYISVERAGNGAQSGVNSRSREGQSISKIIGETDRKKEKFLK